MSEFSEVSFFVNGISCSSCVSAIQNKLEKCNGVINSSVNLTSGKVHLVHNKFNFSIEDIYEQLANIGFTAHSAKNRQNDSYSRLLKFCLYFSVPEFFISMILPMVTSALEVKLVNSCTIKEIVEFLLVLPVQLSAGQRFYKKSSQLFQEGVYSMEMLLLIGTSVTFLFSVLSTLCALIFDVKSFVMYENSSTLITFILLGKLIEEKSKKSADAASDRLASLRPTTIKRINLATDEETNIDISLLQENDCVKVNAGDIIPTDGTIIRGFSQVDEKSITGEPGFQQKNTNDFVCAGSVNITFPLLIKSTVAANKSLIDKVIKTVERSYYEKSKYQMFADKLASYFIPGILILSFCTFLAWLIALFTLGNAYFGLDLKTPVVFYALRFGVSVILFSCPCSISLAIPMAYSVGINWASEKGILIKNGHVFEKCNSLKFVVFDKTGTLTLGHLTIFKFSFNETPEYTLSIIVTVIYELQSFSGHQISIAIRSFLKKHFMPNILAIEGTEHFSFNSSGNLSCNILHNGRKYMVSVVAFESIHANHIITKDEYFAACKNTLEYYSHSGYIVVVVCIDRDMVGYFIISDPIREDASEIISKISFKNKKIIIASGDSSRCTKNVADQLKIREFYAKLSPVGKHVLLKSLKCIGKVAMVGDGINDSAALAEADVGIAVCDCNGVAFQSSDVVLMKNQLSLLEDLFQLSSVVSKTIYFNFFLSFLYNICGIPLASGLFFKKYHFYIHPMISGILMSLSSITVVLVSLSIRWQLNHELPKRLSKFRLYSKIPTSTV